MTRFRSAHWFRRDTRPGRPCVGVRRPRRCLPAVEILEDRTVPASVFWDGGGDGVNWGSAANWSNDILPTAADDVTINAAPAVTVQVASFVGATCNSLQSQNSITLSGGTLTVAAPSSINGTLTLTSPFSTLTANGDLNVGALVQSNGTVTGPGTVTVSGQWTWTSGNQTGPGHTVISSTASLGGGFFSMLDGRTVDNAGTASLVNNSITFRNNAVWNNLAGSTLVFDGSSSFSNFFPGPLAQVSNAGTVRRTGVAAASTIGVPFNNTGTLEVQTGSVSLAGGSSSGLFTLAAGTAVTIAGPYSLLGGSSATGPGAVQVSSFNTLTVAGSASVQNLTLAGGTVTANASLAVQNLALNGGTLTGPGTVTVNGQLTWTSGTMSGTGHTALNGPAAISGGFFSMLDGRTVDNAGTATVAPNDSITFANAAVWNNLAGSTFVLQGTGSVGNFFAAAAQFSNAGTLRKTGAAGTSSIGVALNNTGTVEVTVGTLNLSTGSSSGVFSLAGGTVLNVGGPYTLNAGATATGAGTVQVATFNSLTVAGSASVQNLALAGGTITANSSLGVQNLTFTGGTLTGTGTVTVNGPFTWTNGTMSGTGHTVLNGTSSLAGGFFTTLSGRTVDNAGTASLINNSITFTNNAVWNNLPAGTLVLDGNSAFSNFFAGTAQVNNAGLLRKTGLAGTTATVGIPVSNTGTIRVDAGTLSLSVLTNFAGTTLTGGTYLLSGALQFNGADVRTNNATLVLDGPASAIVGSFGANGLANFATNAAAGSFTVRNGRAFATPVAFSNAGALRVGSGSSFTTAGSYTQSGGSTVVESGGTLSANSTVTLNGGVLAGTGTVGANVVNAAVVSPGLSPGILTIQGNYTQTAAGALNIELAGLTPGTQYDRLDVTGTAALDGALNVSTLGGFLPNFGDTFQVLTFAARTGDFATFNGLDLGQYRLLEPVYNANGMDLSLLTVSSNRPPVLAPIGDRSVNEGSLLTFTATATGPEPSETLTFSLDAGAPVGASIDPATGVFTFTPADGPASYLVTVRVTDNGLPPLSTAETITITVNNVAPTVTAGGDATLAEGGSLSRSGSFSDPGADTWAATVDYGDGFGPQALALNPDKTFSLGHAYADNGTYPVTVIVTDDDGGSGTASFTVTVTNVAPAVTAPPNPTAAEGTEQAFDLGSFADPGALDAPWQVQVSWGDGSAPTSFATFFTGLLGSQPHTYADNGTYSVTVSVTDKDGDSGSATFQVAVGNVAPTPSLNGPDTGVRGQTRTFTVAATDPSPVDQAAGFTFAVDWGDDSSSTTTGQGGELDHVYTATGVYTVTLTVTDKDGGTSTATQLIAISAVELQGDTLAVGGTTGNDTILISRPGSADDTITVSINGVSQGTFAPVAGIIAFGQAGDDDIEVAGGVSLPAELYGGAGNDTLKGGAGPNILMGEEGDDALTGGTGRDVLIGGTGADHLVGSAGQDILIAGDFLPGSRFGDRRQALLDVRQGWTTSDPYADRVAALQAFLAARVTDDGAVDQLIGAADFDWYFASVTGAVPDQVSGRHSDEALFDLGGL